MGEHTLAIVSQHGTATAKFTVKAKPTETATPQPTAKPQPQQTAQPQPTVQPQQTVQPTVQPVSPDSEHRRHRQPRIVVCAADCQRLRAGGNFRTAQERQSQVKKIGTGLYQRTEIISRIHTHAILHYLKMQVVAGAGISVPRCLGVAEGVCFPEVAGYIGVTSAAASTTRHQQRWSHRTEQADWSAFSRIAAGAKCPAGLA